MYHISICVHGHYQIYSINVPFTNWISIRLQNVQHYCIEYNEMSRISHHKCTTILTASAYQLQNMHCTASLSHLRTMLPESSSLPMPAKWPNHATQSLFHSKSLYFNLNQTILDSLLRTFPACDFTTPSASEVRAPSSFPRPPHLTITSLVRFRGWLEDQEDDSDGLRGRI